MADKNDESGRAFPASYPISQSGMTLRDWFAGQALIGLLSGNSSSIFNVADKEGIPASYVAAGAAFGFADAMLDAR